MAGSQSTKQEIPQWLEAQSRGNVEMANEAAKIGYVPYYGPDVAAFTPTQEAAFRNTNTAADAFGLGYASDLGIPQATQFEGGITGYSSAPMYQQAVDQFSQNNPAQYQKLNSFFVDQPQMRPMEPVVTQARSKGGK